MMETTRGARIWLLAAFFTAFMMGMSVISRESVLDGSSTGIAFVALILSGLMLEASVRAALRGILVRSEAAIAGFLFGLPLSFFFLQHKTATLFHRDAIAAGSDRVVAFAGIFLVVAAIYGEWRRRRSV